MHKPDFRTLPLKTLAALLLGLTLTACGGGDDTQSRLDNINDGNTGGDTGGDGGGSGTDDDNEPAQLGRGSADSFVAGEIEVGIGDNALSPGGSTTLAVTMVNGAGELVTSAVDVTFNSECIAEGASILSTSGSESTNTVSTSNGRAEITYTANGCTGADEVTARATYEGQSAGSARATITVESDTVQTLEFLSADPELISLQGTGGKETSEVTFRVLGSTGSPMKDVEVDFALSPKDVGGLSLVNNIDTSDSNGVVSTTVQSGTVATSVRVTASTVGEISTQSSQLAVSTGIPDQNSISISATDLHPIAWGYDGVESTVTIRMADAFNNPAPDGTAVSFTTSGGAIGGSCTTLDGACSVTWTSQSPRPEPSQGFSIEESPLRVVCPDERECRPGRVKVLATAIGNESFVDNNSNGIYEHDTDTFAADNSNGQCDPNVPSPYAQNDEDGCDDLGTAYLDKNFNGQRDNNEEIVALSSGDSGASYESGDGVYNGALCSDVSLNTEIDTDGDGSPDSSACTRDSVTVRDDLLLVMSCTSPYLMPDGGLPGQQEQVSLGLSDSTSISVWVADCNGNGMPAGTVVELNTTGLKNADAAVFPDGPLAGSSEPSHVRIQINASDSEPASGSIGIQLRVPTPNGEITEAIGQSITVN